MMNWKAVLPWVYFAYQILTSGQLLNKAAFTLGLAAWLYVWTCIDVASLFDTSKSFTLTAWETGPFTILAARAAYQKQFYTASAFGLCIAIWLYLSSRPLRSDLPSRSSFLRSLSPTPRNDESEDDTECRICLDDHNAPLHLPCCRLALCPHCIARIYGQTPETYRRNLIEQLFAQVYRHDCPFCRARLFREQAPWQMIPYRVVICTAAVCAISSTLQTVIVTSQWQSTEPIFYSLILLNTIGPALIQCWVVVQAYRHLDTKHLAWWHFFTDVGIALVGWPFALWNLWTEAHRVESRAEYVVASVMTGVWEERSIV